MKPEYSLEWGIQLDCETQGCDPVHADEVAVLRPGTPDLTKPPFINNHVGRWVKRTVTRTRRGVRLECPWREAKDLTPGDPDAPMVTKSGKVLTDADIQALADEAEKGYDVEPVYAFQIDPAPPLDLFCALLDGIGGRWPNAMVVGAELPVRFAIRLGEQRKPDHSQQKPGE